MSKFKTHEKFLEDLKSVWGDEFVLLERYERHDKHLKIYHKTCGRILNKTPKALITSKNGCRMCSAKKNGKIKRKDTKWFTNEIEKLVGDEYEVRGPYIKSNEKIAMYHKTCDREFEITPYSFLGKRDGNGKKGTRCPICAHNTKRDTDDFKREVYLMYGDEFEIIGNYTNRHNNIEIKHNLCNNTLSVRPRHFLDGNTYCRFCSKKERKDTKRFKEQVVQLVGEEYKVRGEYIDAKTYVLMEHLVCGSIYEVTPDNFLRGRRCGHCTDIHNSKGYKAIYNFLLLNDLPFDTQYRDPNCRYIKPLPFDFVIYENWRLDKVTALIEFDGEQHEHPSSRFGGEEEYQKRKRRDKIKDNFAKEKGIPLLRINYKDLNRVGLVLQKKLKEIGIYINVFEKFNHIINPFLKQDGRKSEVNGI